MTADQLNAYTEARVGPREVTDIESEELEAMHNAARHRAAREAYASGFRALTENVFALTLDSAGKAPFSSNTDLLPESIPVCNHITHASVGLPFEIVPDVGALKYQSSDSELAFAAVGDNAIYTRYPGGALANGSTLSVRACKVPSLGSWPTQLEDRLVDAMAELVQERKRVNPIEEVTAGAQ